jgi:hypothetical protein
MLVPCGLHLRYTSAMPNVHPNPNAHDDPDEGRYDVLKGAAAYAPIVAAFGALAVTAIVVVFTVASSNLAPKSEVALSTGLLAVGMVGSLLGAFGLAAIGSETHATANLGGALMVIAVPIVLSIVTTLAAFQVLATVYVPGSAVAFLFITAAGGMFGVVFGSFVISDSLTLRPTTYTPTAYQDWRDAQWIKSRKRGYEISNRMGVGGSLPIAIVFALRLTGIKYSLTSAGINVVIFSGIVLVIGGTLISMARTRHPSTGNDQKSIRCGESVSTIGIIAAYTCALILVLPAWK